jgi:hypothetical protein
MAWEPEGGEPPELDRDNEQERFITHLRREAYAVRDCYTRYSIQILAVSGALLVAIAKFQTENAPYIGLMGFFPVILILMVFSMGAHKFGTSNRLLGYELHLQRVAHYPNRDRCHELMQSVGWEEAMRAWRVVAPTLWAKIYRPSDFFFKRFSFVMIRGSIVAEISEGAKKDRSYGFWFDQERSLRVLKATHPDYKAVQYNAGGFLKTNILVFWCALVACLILPLIAVINMWHLSKPGEGVPEIVVVAVTVCFVFAVALTFLGWLNVFSRIRILESGLQSIHSSAIIWEAAILAHLRALKALKFYGRVAGLSMHGYSEEIAAQAYEISQNATRIHAWISTARVEINALDLLA